MASSEKCIWKMFHSFVFWQQNVCKLQAAASEGLSGFFGETRFLWCRTYSYFTYEAQVLASKSLACNIDGCHFLSS